MKTSTNGIELIKRFEGFSPTPYLCPANYLTIGYGHVIDIKENENNKTKIASKKTVITRLEAEEILREDLSRFEAGVKRLINIRLNQNQFDALVSFTYNLGEGALQRSTLRSKINRGEHLEAAEEFMKWVYAGGRRLKGLVERRTKEMQLYLYLKDISG